MRVLLQRVKKASVTSGSYYAETGAGLLLLVGTTHEDTEKEADYLAEKCVNLRIFEDCEGKMNLSLLEKGGEVLVISQFTLYGDSRKGRRPSFVAAAKPEEANKLIAYFIEKLKKFEINVQEGCFGEHMDIELINDGPVTLMIER